MQCKEGKPAGVDAVVLQVEKIMLSLITIMEGKVQD
jgi:hypothetical protein